MVENGQSNGHGLEGEEEEEAPAIPSTAPTESKYEIPSAKLSEIKVTDYMRECLDKVAKDQGFQNYEIDVLHGSGIGDGFVGILFKVIIREKGEEKEMTVVLKTPPENHARRHAFGALDLFRREVYIYTEVLPAFVQFQEEKNIRLDTVGFANFPKCYFAEYNEEKDDAILIMEDLRLNGYKMWDKFVPTNFEHAKLLFIALGRLHAVSFAFKSQKPELFAKFKELNDFMSEKVTDEAFSNMLNGMIDRAAGVYDDKDIKKRNRALKLKENLGVVMKELVSPKLAEPFSVVGHGDCWSNNFMFQYKRGRPEKIVLLDWQITRYCSPVLDLLYFTFVCTDHELRVKHYDELLGIYHHSLKNLLDHLGGDTMSQFPFTALLRQLKQFGKFGVIMAAMLIPMLATKAEDLPDMDYMSENMDNQDPEYMKEMMKKFSTGNDNYASRMKGALDDAMKFGYL